MFFKAYYAIKWFWRGWNNYTKQGFEKNSREFIDINKIDASNLNVVVTGGSSGIGYAVVKILSQFQNVTIHLVCSNEERGKLALEQLKKTANVTSNILLHIVDITDIASVKAFTQDFASKNLTINVLINNAGSMESKYRTIKNSNIEYSFGLNVLGTKVLTEGFIPIMESPNCYDFPRVITVTSGGALTECLNYNDPSLKCMISKSILDFDGVTAYAQQKRQQIHLTEYWANKYKTIHFMTMHPGWVDTRGVEKSLPSFYKNMKNRLRTPEQGADTIVYLTIDPDVDKNSHQGLLYFDRKPVEKFVSLSQQPSNNEIETFITNLEHLEKQF